MQQAHMVQSSLAGLVAGNVITFVAVGWTLWGSVRTELLLAWLVLQTLNTGHGAWVAWQLRRRPATARNATHRLRRCTWGLGLNSAIWAGGLLAFWPALSAELRLLLVMVAAINITCVLHVMSAWLPAFHAYLWPLATAVFIAGLTGGGSLNVLVAVGAPAVALLAWRGAAGLNRIALEALRSRHEIAALAAGLQAQRDRAEAANAAKSRFLAAASHDLRQPVHALTLMLGAWREQAAPGEDAEAARLRGRVEATAASLAGLFDALLDISRLDAGMVRVEARPFDAAALAARLLAENEEPARARGLQLRARLQRTVVHTDPLLLERVLRNLLANALRYTARGGVAVTARVRRGRVVLRVLDSGPGIAAEHHEAVFDEFVQLHNAGRDRAQGLGLGLAIVRRLCGLLGVEVSLRSRVGHGSVFTLRLPAGLAAVPAPADVAAGAPTDAAADVVPTGPVAPGAGAATAPAAGRGLVVVVDDDDDVRDGMRTLLRGWGHEVLVVGSADEMGQVLRPLSRAPALLICDYRLGGTHTGIDLVRQLREEFNDDELPALLITGDTAPERLREAETSGLHVLHKPVDPTRLRAAMAAACADRAGFGR